MIYAIYILTLSYNMSVSRSVLFVFYEYAYHGCHETMWHIHAQATTQMRWCYDWVGCVTWFNGGHEFILGFLCFKFKVKWMGTYLRHVCWLSTTVLFYFCRIWNWNVQLLILCSCFLLGEVVAPFLTRHFAGQLGESSQTFIYLSCLCFT